jgi:hypothetical protein
LSRARFLALCVTPRRAILQAANSSLVLVLLRLYCDHCARERQGLDRVSHWERLEVLIERTTTVRAQERTKKHEFCPCRFRLRINCLRSTIDDDIYNCMSATMNTRLRSTSLGRKQSIDTDDGRQSIDDFDDIDVNSIETDGKSLAQLVAILKEEDDTGPPAPLPPKGMTTRRSSTTVIPVPQVVQARQVHHQASLPSSMESSGSGFINGIMNPQTSTSSALSHTPPTQTGTSYEMQPFVKRPRSGVSRCCASLSNIEL